MWSVMLIMYRLKNSYMAGLASPSVCRPSPAAMIVSLVVRGGMGDSPARYSNVIWKLPTLIWSADPSSPRIASRTNAARMTSVWIGVLAVTSVRTLSARSMLSTTLVRALVTETMATKVSTTSSGMSGNRASSSSMKTSYQ